MFLGTAILMLLHGSGGQPRRRLSSRRDLAQVSNRFHGEPNILRLFCSCQSNRNLLLGLDRIGSDRQCARAGPLCWSLPNQLPSARRSLLPHLAVIPVRSPDGLPAGRCVYAPVLQVPSEDSAPAIQFGLTGRKCRRTR